MSATKLTAPRAKYHELDELKAAVEEYCLIEFRRRWGDRSARLREWEGLAIDPEAAREHRDLERQQFARARPKLMAIVEEAKCLIGLYERDEPEVNRFVYEAAQKVRSLAEAELGAVEEEVSRKDWIRTHLLDTWYRGQSRDPRPSINEMDPHDLAVLALLAGWWPESVSQSVVKNEGVSVAFVVGREKNCMRSALRDLSSWGELVMSPIGK